MPSIKSLVMGFQKENPRLYEALIEVEKRLSALGSGEGGIGNYARVFSAVGLTIATATPTVLLFDSTLAQAGGMHDNTSLNSRVTIFQTGFYFLSGHIQWPVNGVGVRNFEILINGATVIARESNNAPSAAVATEQNISSGYYLTAGDYAELRVNQTSGGNLIIPSTGDYSPQFVVAAL